MSRLIPEAEAEAAVRQAWHRVVGTAHEADLEHLLALHREAHRYYHTAVHVMWVLRHVASITATCMVDDVGVVEAAALFHDAIYDPRSSTNEADSAALAGDVLTAAGWAAQRCAAVQQLILATAHQPATAHGTAASSGTAPAAPSLAERVLVDADLAILGSDPVSYRAYANAIRTEYAHVTEPDWVVGRSAFLCGMLARPRIFSTPPMHDREARARANLSGEVTGLSPSIDGTAADD